LKAEIAEKQARSIIRRDAREAMFTDRDQTSVALIAASK
jgi:hypothetical protein